MKTAAGILTVWLYCTVAQAAPTQIVLGGPDGLPLEPSPKTYPVLLALSGGGARGLAAIGVLQAFEEKGISVAAVAGTSIGGIVGGLYACGYSPRQLRAIVDSTEFASLFTNEPHRRSMLFTRRAERGRHLLSVRFDGWRPEIPKGLTGAQRLTELLTRLTAAANYRAGRDFTRLPIPFSTVATDIISGESVVLSQGSLADAMRATMAFPLAFTAVRIDGRLLMDGGMLVPVPVDLVRTLCDSVPFVVAVDNTSPLHRSEKLVTPVDIAGQVTTIMTADKLAAQLSRADLVIRPALGDIAAADFKRKDSIIQLGYIAGLAAADSIIAILDQSNSSRRSVYALASAEGINPPPDARWFDTPMTREELLGRLRELANSHRLFRLEATFEPSSDTVAGLSDSAAVRVFLYGTPAPAARGFRWRFIGNHTVPDSVLRQECVVDDSLLTPSALQAVIERIRRRYRTEGYDLAVVRATDVDTEAGTVTITIDEGIIKDIRVRNVERTRGWLVRSYFPLQVGRPFSTAAAAHGISSIYGTDLFDRVTLDLVPHPEGVVVDITVQERKYNQVRLGWHWHDEYRAEQFVELLDDNAFGIGLELSSQALAGPERQEYAVGARLDRIFLTMFTARTRFYYHRLQRATFNAAGIQDGTRDERRAGMLFTLGRQIARLGTATGGIRLEHITYRDSRRAGERVALDTRTLTLRSQVETFDRTPFPTRGHQNLVQIDLTGKLLGGDIEYTRVLMMMESYVTWRQRLTYHPRLTIGLSRRGLPPTERFYMGGLHSFSGLRTNQLAGDKLILFNQELRVRLPLRTYLFARYDAGEVYRSIDEIRLGHLRHGVGASLAFDSPLGPLEFGYGAELNSGIHRWYFQAGFTF